MVRHLRGSLRHADGPVAAESQRPAHVVVTARFSREYIETDRRPAPPPPPGPGGPPPPAGPAPGRPPARPTHDATPHVKLLRGGKCGDAATGARTWSGSVRSS